MNRTRMTLWLMAGAAALAMALLIPQTTLAKGKGGMVKGKGPAVAGKVRPGKAKGPKPKVDKETKKELKLEKKADKAAQKLEKKADKAALQLNKKADKADKAADKAADKMEKKADMPGKRLALGKNKNIELRKHLKRVAKLERLKAIAGKTNNVELQTKVDLLHGKEMKRHQKVLAGVMTKVDAKPTE